MGCCWNWGWRLATVAFAILVTVFRKYVWILIRTFPRDSTAFIRFVKVQLTLIYFQRWNMTVGRVFDRIASKNPQKIILYFENQTWTCQQVQDFSNRIANYFQAQGYKKGDAVAIFMENRPEYNCIWLGLSKIGVIPALINYNLREKSLQHCIDAVSCKSVIYNPELGPALEELLGNGGLRDKTLYCLGQEKLSGINEATDLTQVLKSCSTLAPTKSEATGFYDPLFYIYTSGTTGLPKAAIIKHARFMMAASGNYFMHNLHPSDILYTALPLYHGAGTMLGGGCVFLFGVAWVIRRKFSASNFWKDCIDYNVTAAQYIGEICRYLFSLPEDPKDKQHKVRVMFGNGLRPEIWPAFVKRFNIAEIHELYGSTEGNCNIVNIDNKVGAVGFVPMYAKFLIPMHLIKVDDETGEPIRNPKNGLAIKCGPNEPGELVGRIDKNHPLRDFEGYADKDKTSSNTKKILHDVVKKGDSWFRSGDILEMDECGYFYFKDRKGDTFRWKGENCSTAEVEGVISTVCGLKDAVVYGVEIPGNEGRAGMAAIADPDNSIDLKQLASGFIKSLPTYARPIFVRLLKEIDKTGTYKLKKYDLQKEAYDVTSVKDKIFFLKDNEYIPLDASTYERFKSGQMRL